MPAPRTPDGQGQLGNAERGKAHWPLDLEIHPDRQDDEHKVADKGVAHPLNPPPGRRSTRRAQDDE